MKNDFVAKTQKINSLNRNVQVPTYTKQPFQLQMGNNWNPTRNNRTGSHS